MSIRFAALFLLCSLTLACDDDTPTSPTSTDTVTTTVAEPSMTETFAGTLPVGSAKYYSFTTSLYGTINITLTSIGGAFVPATVMVGLGIGQPSGTECVTTTTVTTAAGTTPQVTGTFSPGVYCARIADVGNLFGPASFSVTIAYP
jgi:hypothetical protein